MPFKIIEIQPDRLNEYARIPIRFEVQSVLQPELVNGGLGGVTLREVPVEPYLKDYDLEESPADWPHQFDVGNWGFFMAFDGETVIGGAAVAFNTAGVNMLEDRPDLAVLWDIRVRPEWRGRGVGKALFEHAGHWSRAHGALQMKVETQNVNVPACHFYQKMGCELGEIHRFGYAAIPHVSHEVMLNWYLALDQEMPTKL